MLPQGCAIAAGDGGRTSRACEAARIHRSRRPPWGVAGAPRRWTQVGRDRGARTSAGPPKRAVQIPASCAFARPASLPGEARPRGPWPELALKPAATAGRLLPPGRSGARGAGLGAALLLYALGTALLLMTSAPPFRSTPSAPHSCSRPSEPPFRSIWLSCRSRRGRATP